MEVEKKCKNCKYFHPTPIVRSFKLVSNGLMGYYRYQSLYYDTPEVFIAKVAPLSTEISNNYGTCSYGCLRACENDNEEYFSRDDLAIFNDAGECPTLVVGKEFGCINFKEKHE